MKGATSPDHTLVVGLARSGIGVARLLHAQGRPVELIDSADSAELRYRAEQMRQEGLSVRLGISLIHLNDELRSSGTTVVVSPGIRWDHPALEMLRSRGVFIQGDLLPAWQASGATPWIAITGTNGKTTVTHLVSHLLQEAGLVAPMGGNVGSSAAEVVLEHCLRQQRPADWLVMEMSSYQIEASPQIAPDVGIWTTLTPDHLERHGTVEAYRAIKRGLLERSRVRLLNADDPDLRAHAASWQQSVQWVSAGPRDRLPQGIEPLLWIERERVWQRPAPGNEPVDLMAADCLAMPGEHNRQNLLLAAAAGLQAGLSGSGMERAFRTFPGVPHRLERIRQTGAIHWFNDSKATNYDAAEVALKALDGPLVALAGGQSKQGDSAAWVDALTQKAAAVVLFGAAAREFKQLLSRGGYAGELHGCEGLDQAVPLAAELAERFSCNAVLLSPACASFDQYSDFEARGDHFRRLVQALP
ncbi:MAG: UDP-N-acetylmuramoyl-L-alanine--D-glutamate ligase [Cyanobacteriota bacterium]|nr:UDP-N-acetylmuramoyl-L-alanine--D-glutamate ligase [Cyanobacteriota bacterium]